MNLTVMIFGSCDYLSFTVVHFAFATFGIPIEQTFVTKLEKVN